MLRGHAFAAMVHLNLLIPVRESSPPLTPQIHEATISSTRLRERQAVMDLDTERSQPLGWGDRIGQLGEAELSNEAWKSRSFYLANCSC